MSCGCAAPKSCAKGHNVWGSEKEEQIREDPMPMRALDVFMCWAQECSWASPELRGCHGRRVPDLEQFSC